MKPLKDLSQLEVGRCLKIDGGHPKYSYKSISVKRLIDNGWGLEVILNRKRNWYFNAVYYLKGESNWVRRCWVLDKYDGRLAALKKHEKTK